MKHKLVLIQSAICYFIQVLNSSAVTILGFQSTIDFRSIFPPKSLDRFDFDFDFL